MVIKKPYHIRLDPTLINDAERLGESKSDVIDKALRAYIAAGRTGHIESQSFCHVNGATKKLYHISLNPDLIAAAERLAGSKSDAIDKALRAYIAGRTGHSDGHAGGQSSRHADGQSSTVSQEKLIEFKKELQKERQKEMEYCDRSIKVLEANVKKLKESVAEIPEIFEAVERITPALMQKIEGCRSEITLRDIKIDDIGKGLENVEDTVKRMLQQRSQDVENSISLNDIKSRVDGEVERLKMAEGKINTLERKEEIRARAEAEAKAKNNVPGGLYNR